MKLTQKIEKKLFNDIHINIGISFKYPIWVGTWLKIIGGSTVVTFVWEQSARQYNVRYKPSAGLTMMANGFIRLFTNVGKFFAWVSSYLKYINIDELVITAKSLLYPIFQFVSSPLHLILGYLSGALDYKNTGGKTRVIFLGSIILIGVLTGSYYALMPYLSELNLPWKIIH